MFVIESHQCELELSAMLWLKSEVAKEIDTAPIRKLVAWLILFSLLNLFLPVSSLFIEVNIKDKKIDIICPNSHQ